jgi:putative spermidine/putrescine transport system ATP-binding protein
MTTHAAASALTQTGTAVEFSGVVKQYGASRALDGLDLRIEPGEFVALLGPSGCGKTTALRSLAGLETVTAGTVSVDGVDVSRTPVNRRDMGMVFQSYSLFPHLTAQDNVEFGLRMRRTPSAERKRLATEALDLVGLGERGGRYAHQLSGGQQQRVALARALVTRPRVLLLDEPLSALDAKVRVQLRDEIRRIQQELGITTLFVTHDQDEALAVADRVAVMRDGHIEQIGTPEELYGRPTTAFVADFVGQSNRLHGTAHNGRVTLLGHAVPLLNPSLVGSVLCFIRPEDITLLPAGPGTGVRGTVVSRSFHGSFRRTTVEVGPELVVAQHAASLVFAPGDEVTLTVTATEVTAEAVALA